MAAGKLLATAGLGAALVAGGFFAVAEKGRTSLRSDVEAFFEAAAAGNLDEAYAATSNEFQKEHPRGEFETLLNDSGFAQFKSLQWSHVGFDEEGGVASGIIETKDGKSLPFDLNLERDDGKWLLREIIADGRSATDKGA